MTPRADSLTVPPLDAFPFINIAHFVLPHGFKHDHNEDSLPNQAGDADFQTDNFEFPENVGNAQMAPVRAMSDETFARLFKILRPIVFGEVVQTRDDLSRIAVANMAKFIDKDTPFINDPQPGFTLDQLETYLLAKAELTFDIHWGQLAELYNGSAPEQQEAIHQYFVYCLNRTLSRLMDIPPPIIPLPDSLQEVFQSKEVDGVTFLFSDLRQTWMREDRFNKQFRIDGYHSGTKTNYLLATTPTLSQAIAKASLFLKGKNSSSHNLDSITVRLNGRFVASAKTSMLGYAEDMDLMDMLMLPSSLKWDLSKLNEWVSQLNKERSEAEEKARDSESPDTRKVYENSLVDLDFRIPLAEKMAKGEFRKVLYATEKALDLQWSKVAHLEDDLGL